MHILTQIEVLVLECTKKWFAHMNSPSSDGLLLNIAITLEIAGSKCEDVVPQCSLTVLPMQASEARKLFKK